MFSGREVVGYREYTRGKKKRRKARNEVGDKEDTAGLPAAQPVAQPCSCGNTDYSLGRVPGTVKRCAGRGHGVEGRPRAQLYCICIHLLLLATSDITLK